MSTTTPTNIFGYTYKHYCEKPINKKVLNTYPIFFDWKTDKLTLAMARVEVMEGNIINLQMVLEKDGKQEKFKMYNIFDETISGEFVLGEAIYCIPHISLFGKVNLVNSIFKNVIQFLPGYKVKTGVYKTKVDEDKWTQAVMEMFNNKRSLKTFERKNYRVHSIVVLPCVNYKSITFVLFFWSKNTNEPYKVDVSVYAEKLDKNAKKYEFTLFDVAGKREQDFVENMCKLYPYFFSFFDISMFILEGLLQISRMYAEKPPVILDEKILEKDFYSEPFLNAPFQTKV